MIVNINNQIPINQIICLSVSSYVGTSVGAEHYYGKLSNYDYDDTTEIQLMRKIIEEKERQHLSKKLQHPLKIGYAVEGFTTEQHVIDVAIQEYKKHFPDAKVLLLGERRRMRPHKILRGPRQLKTQCNRIYREYEGIYKKIDVLSYSKPHLTQKLDNRIDQLVEEWIRIFPQN